MNVANNQALFHSMSSDIAWVWVTQDKHVYFLIQIFCERSTL